MKPEQSTQIAILEWLELQYPKLRKLIIKIDNEGQRKEIVKDGKRVPVGLFLALRMGLHPSASDLFLPYPKPPYHGLFMEVKPDNWKCKSTKEKIRVENQKSFGQLMESLGYKFEFVIGTEEGVKAFKRYLS